MDAQLSILFVRTFFLEGREDAYKATFYVPYATENGAFRCNWHIEILDPALRCSYGEDGLHSFVQALITVDLIFSIERRARRISQISHDGTSEILPSRGIRELLSEREGTEDSEL